MPAQERRAAMPTDEKPPLGQEIVDAVEDEEAIIKNRIERFGFWVWERLTAFGRALRGVAKPRRRRPF
jgi:hypothetical protein